MQLQTQPALDGRRLIQVLGELEPRLGRGARTYFSRILRIERFEFQVRLVRKIAARRFLTPRYEPK